MGQHHHHTANDDTQNLKLVFWLNLSFACIELIGGIMSNSVAIISDALHDLGDSLSILLAWILAHVATKPATPSFSYGWQRFSLMGAFINALILLIGASFIIYSAMQRLHQPEPVSSPIMLGLALLGVIVNGAAVLKLRRGKSLNARVISLHLWEDVLGWIAVLIGAIIIFATQWYWVDAALAILISLFILGQAIRALIQSGRLFLQAIPSEISLSQLSEQLKNLPGVIDVHDFHVWSLDGEHHVASLHVKIKEGFTPHKIKNSIKSSLATQDITHVTIEIEQAHEACTHDKKAT